VCTSEMPAAPGTYPAATGAVDAKYMQMMQIGCIVHKHDYSRNKRVRRRLMLSSDGLSIRWMDEAKGGGGTPRLTPLSLISPRNSTNGASSVQLSDVVQLIYGPYTENLRRKPASERVDPVWCCFSMEMRSGERTLDFAFEDEGSALPWLCGLQQLISFFAPVRPPAHLTWTMPKLRIQKLRLKLTGEVEDTNEDVVNVLTSVVRDAAWGVSTKVVALQHVVIDVDGTPIGVGDGKDRVVQCV